MTACCQDITICFLSGFVLAAFWHNILSCFIACLLVVMVFQAGLSLASCCFYIPSSFQPCCMLLWYATHGCLLSWYSVLFSKSLFVFVIFQGGFSLLACCRDIQSCCSDIWQQLWKVKEKNLIKQILFKTFGALLHRKHYLRSLTRQGNITVALIVMISVISQAVFSMDMFCHYMPSCNQPSCMLLWYTKPFLCFDIPSLLVLLISQAVFNKTACGHDISSCSQPGGGFW